MRNINSLLKKIDIFVKMAQGWTNQEPVMVDPASMQARYKPSDWVNAPEDDSTEPEPNQSVNPEPNQSVNPDPSQSVSRMTPTQTPNATPVVPATSAAPAKKQVQTTYGGKVGAAAASVANTLKTLVALPDAQKEASQKQIDDAKKRLIPYLAKTLMPYLPGDVQDEYTGIINSFNTKYNLLVQKSPY